MKFSRSIAALLAVASCSSAALAFDFVRKGPGQAFVDRNCAWCHGPSFQGFTTAPRLAGQKAAYIEDQLINFKAHTRDNPLSQQVMWGAARGVPQEAAHDIADYLSSIEPEPANDGHSDLEDRGRNIYQVGDGAANVPACVVCHGPEGQGAGAIPRIGGLSYRYLERRLGQWGEGYHASAKFPMPAVANQLSPDEIAAIASYLSFIR
jgi:cytochrome c553